MSVSLIQKLEAIKLTKFKWSSFEKHISTPDEKGEKFPYLEFHLVEPIERVKSSNSLYNPETDERVPLFKDDVKSIKCKVDLIGANENDFVFSEVDGKIDPANCTGSYEGDLFLDLSRAGDAWLTDTKFSKFAADQKRKGRNERLQKALAKL